MKAINEDKGTNVLMKDFKNMGFRVAGLQEFMEIHKFLIMLAKIKEPLLAMELLP